jgi:anti-sigma factor RsiW
MLSCEDVQRLIAQEVDGVLSTEDRARLDVHLESCTPCRAELASQREVSALLRARVPQAADLASKVAARLDREAGMLGLANWRAWTLGLAPVAAALMLAAYLGIGASTSNQGSAVLDESSAQSTVSTPVLMQPGTTGDALVEAVLTDGAASTAGSSDVR